MSKHIASTVMLGGVKYICVEHIRLALKDDEFVMESLAVLRVGIDRGDGPSQAMRCAIGNVIMELAGEFPPEHTVPLPPITGNRSRTSDN